MNEGDSTTLAGLGEQPVTKAWLQLYSDGDFSGRYAVIDFLDWSKDDWDDFGNLEGTVFDAHFGFNNEASSARWFTLNGTQSGSTNIRSTTVTIRRRRALLTSHGEDDDLGGLEDDIMSAEFRPGVASYYSGTPDVFWDTRLDGSSPRLESSSRSRQPSSMARVVNVPVKAVHPVDGLAGYANAPVRVLNVAPAITQLALFNSLNQQLGVTVPFFLEGLPVTVRGSFTDPGKPDHQTAVINWGDSLSTSSASFDAFSDAFGGATGQLSHTRTYVGAGNFNLSLNVTDDDARHDGAVGDRADPHRRAGAGPGDRAARSDHRGHD